MNAQGMFHEDGNPFGDPTESIFGGRPGFGHQQQQQRQSPKQQPSQSPPTLTSHRLPLTLQDLFNGVEKKLKIVRKVRSANGLEASEEILVIPVKKGWKAGTKITFAGKGDDTETGGGDLEFIVEEKSHPVYTRKGDDLVCQVQVPLMDCYLGFERSLTGIDGRPIKLVGIPVVQPGSEITVKGAGMPNKNGGRGDLIAIVRCSLPKVDNEQLKLLRGIFL